MKSTWLRVRIGDWGEVQAGRQRSPHLTAGSARPYLRVANVFDGYIDATDVLSMNFTDAEFARYRLRPGDILLNEGQSIELVGRSAMYEGVPERCAFQNTLVRFRAGPTCDPTFARILFKQLFSEGVLQGIAKRTTSIAHLGVSRFANLVVSVPPRVVQRTIASYERRVSAHLEQIERLIAAKVELRRGLAHQLLTGKKRFPEFRHSTVRQRGEFGTLPADWHVERIADIASERSIRGAGDDTLVYSCTKHGGLVPSLEYFGKQVFSRNLSVYKRLEEGDFAYATNHIEEGSIGLLHAGMAAGVVSPMYTAFRCDAAINPEFLYAVLKIENYRRVFARRTSASVNRRGSLRWKEFSKIRVPVPSRAEQDRIVAVLELAKAELVLLEQQRDLYTRYKRGLMASLLSGEIKVPA